jgi:hypothetical protein
VFGCVVLKSLFGLRWRGLFLSEVSTLTLIMLVRKGSLYFEIWFLGIVRWLNFQMLRVSKVLCLK